MEEELGRDEAVKKLGSMIFGWLCQQKAQFPGRDADLPKSGIYRRIHGVEAENIKTRYPGNISSLLDPALQWITDTHGKSWGYTDSKGFRYGYTKS